MNTQPITRVMPDRVNLGRQFASVMATPMQHRRVFMREELPNPNNYRVVMGYFLPAWQRGLVWTLDQKVRFLESAWLGLNLGTFTYNQADIGSPLDNLLIDGQQRLHAIECYLNDEFPVFGYRWSEVTDVDRRMWEMSIHFRSYVTETEDEAYLRNYYNLMNFGGTAHRAEERA